MDNLHFIPNKILTNFFKELTKYKNDNQQYLNYMYIYIYIYIRIILYILLYILSVSMYMHGITSQYTIIIVLVGDLSPLIGND